MREVEAREEARASVICDESKRGKEEGAKGFLGGGEKKSCVFRVGGGWSSRREVYEVVVVAEEGGVATSV